MSRETMAAVVSFARRFPFRIVDVTGGAPELVPDLPFLIDGLAPLAPRLMLRTNLSAVNGAAWESLLALCVAHRVVLVASFPSTNPSQADAQRGAGVTETAIAVLKKLNAAGYGVDGTGLELDLVSNPVGAFLPVSAGVRRTEIPARPVCGNGGSRSTACTRSRTYRWGVSGHGCCGREITNGI